MRFSQRESRAAFNDWKPELVAAQLRRFFGESGGRQG